MRPHLPQNLRRFETSNKPTNTPNTLKARSSSDATTRARQHLGLPHFLAKRLVPRPSAYEMRTDLRTWGRSDRSTYRLSRELIYLEITLHERGRWDLHFRTDRFQEGLSGMSHALRFITTIRLTFHTRKGRRGGPGIGQSRSLGAA